MALGLRESIDVSEAVSNVAIDTATAGLGTAVKNGVRAAKIGKAFATKALNKL